MKSRILILAVSLLFPFALLAQNPQGMPSDEEIENKMYESIEKELKKYVELLKIDDSQMFYIDSILTRNYNDMRLAQMKMSKGGMSSVDAYQKVIDECFEKNYQAFKLVLTEAQWEKYLKIGAYKEKINRDKRKAKREAKGIY